MTDLVKEENYNKHVRVLTRGQRSEVSELTFHEVQVSFAPNVSMQSGEDADGLGAGLLRSAADPLQLDAQLI